MHSESDLPIRPAGRGGTTIAPPMRWRDGEIAAGNGNKVSPASGRATTFRSMLNPTRIFREPALPTLERENREHLRDRPNGESWTEKRSELEYFDGQFESQSPNRNFRHFV